jgi:hypothetical protein
LDRGSQSGPVPIQAHGPLGPFPNHYPILPLFPLTGGTHMSGSSLTSTPAPPATAHDLGHDFPTSSIASDPLLALSHFLHTFSPSPSSLRLWDAARIRQLLAEGREFRRRASPIPAWPTDSVLSLVSISTPHFCAPPDAIDWPYPTEERALRRTAEAHQSRDDSSRTSLPFQHTFEHAADAIDSPTSRHFPSTNFSSPKATGAPPPTNPEPPSPEIRRRNPSRWDFFSLSLFVRWI